MVTVWFGVGQFLSGAMGQLYPGGDTSEFHALDIALNNAQEALNAASDALKTSQNILQINQDTIEEQINSQKGIAGGIATLDAQKKLVQMPTAADVGAIPITQKGSAGGIAELDDSAHVPLSQIERSATKIYADLNSPFKIYYGLYFYKDMSGIVHVEGSIAKDTGENQIITTLPIGYRPTAHLVFLGYNWQNTSYIRIIVNEKGEMICETTDQSVRIDIAISFLSQS